MDSTLPESSSPKPRSKVPWVIAAAVVALAGLFTVFFLINPDEGVVEFKLSDPKANVSFQVDGKDLTLAADNSVKLPAGIHELTATGPDHEPATLSFRVKRGGRDVVNVELKAKPKSPPPVVKLDPDEEKRRKADADKLLELAAKLLDESRAPDVLALLDRALQLHSGSARALALRGRAYLAQGELSKAKACLLQAHTLDGIHTDVLLGLGVLAWRERSPDLCKTRALEALRGDPDLPLAHALLGGVELMQGRFADGLRSCDRAIKSNPKLLRAWQNRALAHGCLSQWDEALADLDMVIKLDDSDAYAYLVKAEVLARLNKLETARAERAKALQLEPRLAQRIVPVFAKQFSTGKGSPALDLDKAKDLGSRALSALGEGYADKAMELAEAALRLDSKCVLALAARGAVHFLQDEKIKAKADCDLAIRLDSGLVHAYVTRSLLYEDKDADRIVADATAAVTISPTLAKGYARRGVGYLRLHEYHQALKDCTVALRDPKETEPYKFLGEAYALIGDFDRSLAHYDEYLKRMPKEDPRVYLLRAGVYLKKNDRLKALADLKKAAELDDDLANEEAYVFPDASKKKDEPKADKHAQRAQAHVKAGKLESALADWTIALRLEEKWHWQRALVFLARGDFAAARADLTEAIFRDTKNPELYRQRAEAHARQANFVYAIQDLNEALALDGKHAKTLWLRSVLHQRLGNVMQAAEDGAAALQLDPALAKAATPDYPSYPYTARGLDARYDVFTPWDEVDIHSPKR